MLSNITIIGTSHIAKDSIRNIEKAFSEKKPEFVCVELDPMRYEAILHKQKPNFGLQTLRAVGFQGYLFAVIGHFLQKKLGNIVGTEPGSDMMKGIELAQKNNVQVVFIDRFIQITLQRFSKKFSFKEKMRLLWDIIKSPFPGQQKIAIDLSKTPKDELIVTLLTAMKDRYPNLFKVLVDERNHIMAKKLYVLAKQNPDKQILAVMGAGHVPGVKEILQDLEKNPKFHVV